VAGCGTPKAPDRFDEFDAFDELDEADGISTGTAAVAVEAGRPAVHVQVWPAPVGVKWTSAYERASASAQLDAISSNDVGDGMSLLERGGIDWLMSGHSIPPSGQAALTTR
jgi:hypothetical protein